MKLVTPKLHGISFFFNNFSCYILKVRQNINAIRKKRSPVRPLGKMLI